MILKEKVLIIIIISMITYVSIIEPINLESVEQRGGSWTYSMMALMGFGWYYSITSFEKIVSGDFIQFNDALVSFFLIVLLWISLPIMFLLTREIRLRNRILYIWIFCTHLSFPLLTLGTILGLDVLI